MTGHKNAVIRITAKKCKSGFECKDKTLLVSDDYYNQSRNPFFKFIFEEIKKVRKEQKNEKECN